MKAQGSRINVIHNRGITKKINRIIRMSAFTLVLAFAIFGCRTYKYTTAKELASVEVKEYHGEKLSSINDFIENSIKGPQYIDKNNYRMKITGLVYKPQELTYNQVLLGVPKYKKVTKLDCVEGWGVKILWDGILVRDLLEKAIVKPEAKTVIFKAHDGYSTSFPIDYFYKKDILLANKMNGVDIPAERGYPFMLVAEDKWGYKWCKWVTEIELSSNINYRGYWENRGYSNTGDLNKPFIGP